MAKDRLMVMAGCLVLLAGVAAAVVSAPAAVAGAHPHPEEIEQKKIRLEEVVGRGRDCSYRVRIKTSCRSPRLTRDAIAISFGDAYNNQVYAAHLDDPWSKTFERCSTDTFDIYGPCGYGVCYLYLWRDGSDGWIPDWVDVYDPYYAHFVTFTYGSSIPPRLWIDTLGALDYQKIVSGEPWRLISCIWLHGGVIHLLANMLSLLFIGVRLEQEFGFVKIGILYILSGIGGSLMSAISIQSKISVGASGALFGLLGGMLSELLINWTLYANKCAALLTLVVVIALNLAIGLVPHVDSSAHIGGFISGFLLGFILLIRPQFGWINHKQFHPGYDKNHTKPKHKVYQYVLWSIAFILLVVWLLNNIIQLFDHHKLRS